MAACRLPGPRIPDPSTGEVHAPDLKIESLQRYFLSAVLHVCVFRTDLITAMKLHDSYQLNPDEYYVLADPWRQEWEKGVQLPVSPGTIPQPVASVVSEEKSLMFIRPKKYIVSSGSEPPELGYVDIRTLADSVCCYDLNDMDAAWLELTNEEFKEMGMPELDEYTMERVLEEFEQRCYDNMNHAIETEEGLGIEYDEDVVCDVCQSPDGEDGNEMVFCDKCNMCVHQACYGILKAPEGSWLCRTCVLGVQAQVFAGCQEGRSDEAHAQWDQVGARQLHPVDPRGEHWQPREDGAHHEGVSHPQQSVGACVQPLQREVWGIHTVLREELSHGLPRDLCV